jgi:murein DD-endopeptidase MepM/ murein hydrolase activator NlpD
MMMVAVFMSACSGGEQAQEGDGKWAYPFPLQRSNGCYRVATPFSVENPWDRAHEAVDFACLPSTPVYAVESGIVNKITHVDVSGTTRARVTLELDGFRLQVEYINLEREAVEPEQRVERGEQIGWTATGLHLAVWDVEMGQYVDPGGFLVLPIPEAVLE